MESGGERNKLKEKDVAEMVKLSSDTLSLCKIKLRMKVLEKGED